MNHRCGTDRRAGSASGRWRCAIGWAIYLLIAILVVVTVTAAGQSSAAQVYATHAASCDGTEGRGGGQPRYVEQVTRAAGTCR
jgi:hypothetical protein